METLRSKPVILVVVSFLFVVLICSSTSASAKIIKQGPISCNPVRGGGGYFVTCCQDFTYSNGVTKTYCTDCDNTQPPSNCSQRYEALVGGASSTGLRNPAGNALPPPGNGTSTLPPGNIIKVLPGTTNAGTISTTGNNTGSVNGTTVKIPPGAFKPTGNLTNALQMPNNTGTSHPPPTLLAKQPTGHHHHKGGGQISTPSSSNTNSTGRS
jgi:hypothetical protein